MPWKKRLLWPLIIAASLIAACSNSAGPAPSNEGNAVLQPESGTYQTLSVAALATILSENPEDYTIINVHIPYAGEIEGTDANIAFDDLDALMAALPDKHTPVILYCRSGNMSAQAAQALLAEGYTQVWDIPGGMNAWQANGGALVDR